MKLDDILLMAYVDGELPPQERQQVETEIASSPDVAERVALLTASCLAYREAFAHQKLPPVPARLTKTIEEMVRVGMPAADTGINDANIGHGMRPPPSAPVRSWLRVAPMWLAVAFVAGAFFCGAVLRLAPGVAPGLKLARASDAPARPGASPWILAAVGYQQLYSRETLAQKPVDADTSARTVEKIRREDGLPLRIPDLRDAGLTFKRVQRLTFDDRPLIQIVYLPEKGPPIALCVVKGAKTDQPMASQRVGDIDVVTWRQAELGYALIGNSNGIDLTALAKRISDRSVQSIGAADIAVPILAFS